VQKKIQKITPFLWFDDQAEDAAKFYVSIFKDRNSKISPVARNPGVGGFVRERRASKVASEGFRPCPNEGQE